MSIYRLICVVESRLLGDSQQDLPMGWERVCKPAWLTLSFRLSSCGRAGGERGEGGPLA